LDEKKAEEIRKLYQEGIYTFSDLGRKYNIDPSGILRIIQNKIWRIDEAV